MIDAIKKTPIVWVVSEGIAGMENQGLAVAAALGVDPVIKRVQLRGPWKVLSPYLGFECRASFSDPDDLLAQPWPDVVIGAGRKAIPALRFIAARAAHRPILVYLQDPRFRYADFDVVAVPQHDVTGRPHLTRLPNILITRATPNRVTESVLDTAKTRWAERFAQLPAPRVAVLIGGNSRDYVMDTAATTGLARDIRTLLTSGASVMMTLSRRTPPAMAEILRTALVDHPRCFIWDGQGDNPFHGMLAWADTVCVTGESASMLSDAGTTGRPVYILNLTLRTGRSGLRIKALQDKLIADGVARPFAGHLEPAWTYEKLNDASMIAAHIRGYLTARGFT